MSPLLGVAVWRHALRHPVQLALAVLGIALGVAVVVSIDLANASAQRAFELSAEGLAGRATHVIEAGPAGLPEQVYVDLRLGAGVRRAAPVVEGHVALLDHPGRTLLLLGLDPFADRTVRSFVAAPGAVSYTHLTLPTTILV